MRTISLLIPVLCLALWGTTTRAEPPPPVPDGGLRHLDQGVACTDYETGLDGKCFHSLDLKNNYYIAFYTFGDLCMVIWQVKDGQNVELWRRGADV